MSTPRDFAREVVIAISELEKACATMCAICSEARDEEKLKAYSSEDEHWYHDVGGEDEDCEAEDIQSVISDLETAVIIAGYSFLFDNIHATEAPAAQPAEGGAK